MIYRDYKNTGIKTSLLGMGNMRLPTIPGTRDAVDWEKAQEIIDYAYAHGINYYDTAYVYHGGESEKFIGAALKKYPRESYYLATKMPGFMMSPNKTAESVFNEQLERCGVDYFDFYLCHNLNESSIETYLDPEKNIIGYLDKMKAEGKIRYLGFSSHAKIETLRRFVPAYNWDFAQIQCNYLDWTMQDAKQQYEILEQAGIPTIIMEPCRGGRLAALCPEADDMLKGAVPDKSIASWAFRWLQRLPNVQVILSGMTNLDQIKDNVATFETLNPLSDGEAALLEKAVELLKGKVTVPCTACRYCCDGCPAELDIPKLMSLYNEYAIAESPMSLMELDFLPDNKKPDKCIGCGNCTSACPQGIDIPGIMAKLTDAMSKMPKMPMGPPKD